MIKTIRHIISLCAVTSLLALSFVGCAQPTIPETKYKVSFNENGHGDKLSPIEVTENTVLTVDQLKPLTADGYTFVGWFDGEKEAEAGVYKVTKDVTIIAHWTTNKYKVTFNQNGHGTKPAQIEVDYNTALTSKQLEPLKEDGYTFEGWFDGNEKAVGGSYKVIKNVTLNAHWTPWDKVADVTFSKKGAVDYKDTITLSCDTKGATIYYTIDNGIEQTSSTDVSLNIEKGCSISAYATKEGMTKSNSTTIEFTIKTYTVTFKNDKGKAPDAIPGLKKNSTVKPEQIKQLDNITGFDFAGWTVDGKKFDENYPITQNITVIANWKKWEKVANVKFNVSSSAVDYNDEVVLTCATEGAKIHYIKGDEDEAIVDSPCTITLSSPCSITAYGTKERMYNSDKTTENYTFKNYTVSYDTKGIVPQPESYTGWKGDIVTPLPTIQDVKGFTFDGWYNGDTKITDTSVEIGTSDITLTAKWIPHYILSNGKTIRYDENLTNDQKNSVIAVACGINSKGKLLGIGFDLSDEKLAWAKEGTLASEHDFTEIACKQSNNSEKLPSFIGDTDGSDNWNVIVNEYIKAGKTEQDALKDCPAFAWANNYGKNYIDSPDYQDGWYIPSCAEFYLINNNLKEINKAFTKIRQSISNNIINFSFWSSTPLCDSSQHFVYSSNGILYPMFRTNTTHVCCIRVFE